MRYHCGQASVMKLEVVGALNHGTEQTKIHHSAQETHEQDLF